LGFDTVLRKKRQYSQTTKKFPKKTFQLPSREIQINNIKGRFSQAFRWAIKLAILLKTSTFTEIKNKILKKQTKQSRAILLAILAYVQTGL
jgi:hypothetical protein